MNGKRTRWLRQHRIQIRPTCSHTWGINRIINDRWRCRRCHAEVNRRTLKENEDLVSIRRPM